MKRLRRILLVMALGVAGVLGVLPATGASAATGCSGFQSNLFQLSQISCSTGSYAATIVCKNWLGWSAYAQGPRAWAPWASQAYCPSGYPFLSHGGYIIYS